MLTFNALQPLLSNNNCFQIICCWARFVKASQLGGCRISGLDNICRRQATTAKKIRGLTDANEVAPINY